jgi:hypothetical protein
MSKKTKTEEYDELAGGKGSVVGPGRPGKRSIGLLLMKDGVLDDGLHRRDQVSLRLPERLPVPAHPAWRP